MRPCLTRCAHVLIPLFGVCLTPVVVAGQQTRQVAVQAHTNAPDLVCPVATAKPKPKPQPRPAGESQPADAADAWVVPDAQAVQEALADSEPPESQAQAPSSPALTPQWMAVGPKQTFRVAFWGDSHLAAGFFTQELGRRAGLEPDQVHSAFVAATLTRPGVRLPVRKACASPEWRHESAHAVTAAALTPGPALVSQVAAKPDASLAWDLRNAQREPTQRSVSLLFQQTDEPIRIAIRIDGGPEQELRLEGIPGPSALELQGDAPLSTLQLRLIAGSLRNHGLGLRVPESAHLQVDLFALPGATVRGWQNANLDYLRTWFSDAPPYQLVVLAYGTNEGNEKPFDATAYGQTLRQSVVQLKQVFPQAACLLIGPGDRGILVPRTRPTKKQAGHKTPAKKQGPAVDLLKYSRIHAQITRIQQSVGREMGCQTWSMMLAMGGKAGVYTWVRQRPPLMANDLIHFTVPGYQHLAQTFARDIGWTPQSLWLAP